MMYVKLLNSGGVLDTREARNYVEAALVAVTLINECGELHDGDQIVIEGYEEDGDHAGFGPLEYKG
jgi:hypothetical protein